MNVKKDSAGNIKSDLKMLFKGLRPLDLVLFLSIALGSIFLYQYFYDQYIQVLQSKDLISVTSQGKVLQFYDYVLEKAVSGGYGSEPSIYDAAYYNIFLYAALAIIILPWVIFSKVTAITYNYFALSFYIKTVLLLLVIFSSYFVYRTCKAFTLSDEKSKTASILFLTSSIVLYASVGFNQLDIIYILFLILALEQYGKRHLFRFSFLISFAIMLKTFPVAICIPMILLIEKRPLKILEYGLATAIAPIVYSTVFSFSEGYVTSQKVINSSYSFSDSLFQNGIEGGLFPISLMIIGMVFICSWAYSIKVTDSISLYKMVMLFGTAIYGMFFIFVLWHSQWGILLALFTSMLLPVLPNNKLIIYVDTVMSLSYLISVFAHNPANIYMLNNGLLTVLTRKTIPHEITGGDPIHNIGVFVFSVFAACILELIFFGYKSLKLKDTEQEYLSIKREDIYLRMAPLLAFQTILFVFFFIFAR